MLPNDSYYPKSSDSYLNLLLEDCEVSSPTSSKSLSCFSKNSHNDAQEEILDDTEEEDLTDEVLLMSSISLDDSAHFFTADEENNNNTPYQEPSLFDSKQQKYEWDESFSILLQLKTSRLTTIVEEQESQLSN